MDEALQMFVSLKQMGVPSKVVLIHNEGHELNRGGRPANRVIRLNALCEWFDKYLDGGPRPEPHRGIKKEENQCSICSSGSPSCSCFSR